jgi:hypothetical protein
LILVKGFFLFSWSWLPQEPVKVRLVKILLDFICVTKLETEVADLDTYLGATMIFPKVVKDMYLNSSATNSSASFTIACFLWSL